MILKKSILAILLLVIVSLKLTFDYAKWDNGFVLKWDASGYYLYLPATIIYKDLATLSFYDKIDQQYALASGMKSYGLYPQKETHKVLNKYAIGTALGELPLFLVAHAYCLYINSSYALDGYSMPYQFSVAMSTVLWTILGMFFLAAVLRRYFSDTITALCILCIGFGTNLYCYTGYELATCHTWLFLLVAATIYYTDSVYRTAQSRDALMLGVVLGLVLISRPIDILIVILPLLWPLTHTHYRTRFSFLQAHRRLILLCVSAFFCIAFIQLLYWKYMTGHWLHFSYEEEGFHFLSPKILEGLFSFRKGWFVYTPIALLAFFGFRVLHKLHKGLSLPILLFLGAFIYVVFSWHCWWYGWSFGSRVMIDAYPLLAFPLAALMQYCFQKKMVYRMLLVAVLGFFVWLNQYQTIQYILGTLPGDKITGAYYWRCWNKLHVDESMKQFLLP